MKRHRFTLNGRRRETERAAALLAPIFAHHGWGWIGVPRENGVPNADEIAGRFNHLIDTLEQVPDATISSSGRLVVEAHSAEPGDPEWIELYLHVGTIEARPRRNRAPGTGEQP